MYTSEYTTDMYEGMLAETVTLLGANGDTINAYFARPLGPGPFPAMVVIHHMPGWDEWYREATRKFAHHGYLAFSPNLYARSGHAAPDDVAAAVRATGRRAGRPGRGRHRRRPCTSCARCPNAAAKSASSAPVPAGDTPTWPPAVHPASTPWSTVGAAAWSWPRRT